MSFHPLCILFLQCACYFWTPFNFQNPPLFIVLLGPSLPLWLKRFPVGNTQDSSNPSSKNCNTLSLAIKKSIIQLRLDPLSIMVHAVFSMCKAKQEMSVLSPVLSAVEIEAILDHCVTCMPMIPVLLKWCCGGLKYFWSMGYLYTVLVVMLGRCGELDRCIWATSVK